MNRISWSRAIAFALSTLPVFCLAPALQADDQRGCSYRSVSGEWGYLESGSFLSDPNSPAYPNDNPTASLGTFSLDRNGNIRGRGSFNGGGVLLLTYSGTYTVNSDCTGTMTVDIVANGEDQGIFHYNLVFVDSSREVFMVSMEPEFVHNKVGKKLFGD